MNMMTSIIEPPAGRLVPPIALLRSLPAGPLAEKYQRLSRLAELFAAFDRDDMELGVDLLLAELDARDGDPDAEPDGDELDASGSEEDFMTHYGADWDAGCPISDPGGCDSEPAPGLTLWPVYGVDQTQPLDLRDYHRQVRQHQAAESWSYHSARAALAGR